MYFNSPEDPVLNLVDDIMYNISEKKRGFYDSIFATKNYHDLDFIEKQRVVDIICGEYLITDLKDLVDYCIQEKLEKYNRAAKEANKN